MIDCQIAEGGRWDGDVRVDGHPQQKDTFARISGYAQQFDIHSPQVRKKNFTASRLGQKF